MEASFLRISSVSCLYEATSCSVAMVFGRKKGFLSSWTSRPPVETEPDLELKARAHKLEVMHKTLAEIQFNIQVYLASWHAMCQASRAIAVGLAKLTHGSGGDGGGGGGGGGVGGEDGGGGEGVNAGGRDKKVVSSLMDTARLYSSAQRTIDGLVREPAQRVLEETTLRETGTLLSRFPPIFGKIARRKQLLVDVEAAKARVRTAEAAREKERDSFSAVAGKEHRSRMAAALATTVSAVGGLTAEVIADADRLERERGTMLVPQISALVGCQAYFMRRSAAVLEKLAGKLPYSAVALCRLLRPGALEAAPAPIPSGTGPPRTRHRTSSSSSTITAVDVSGHSVVSSPSPRRATTPPPLPARRGSHDARLEQTTGGGRRPPPGGASTSASRSPPPEVGPRRSSFASSSSSSSSSWAAKMAAADTGPEATRPCPAAAAAASTSAAPRLVEPQTGAAGEVVMEEWGGAAGQDGGVEEEVVW